jgi:hypothetical protein
LTFLADEVEVRRRARNWSPLLLEVDRMISSMALLLSKLWPAHGWPTYDFIVGYALQKKM